MPNIINFPTHKTKVYTIPGCSVEVPTEQAVNELTCELLCEVIPVYIDRGWSLSELDAVVWDFKTLMIASAPPVIRREELDMLKERLRPIWKDLMESVRGPRDY